MSEVGINLNEQIQESLRLLLKNTRLFEGCDDEIDIWIESVKNFEKTEDRLQISSWIAHIFKKVSRNTEKYLSSMHKIITESEKEMDEKQDQNEIFNGKFSHEIDY